MGDGIFAARALSKCFGYLYILFSLSACPGQKVAFSDASEQDSTNVVTKCLDVDCTSFSVNETSSNTLSTAPNDILFVLDDSVSMSVIYDQIKAGFASLQNSTFPKDARMAVTYMSPDQLNPDGSINFGVGFSGLATPTPGHLKLVTSAAIASFLSLPDDGHQQYLTLKGCADEWFAPGAVNALGERCLDSAVQSPLYATGVEAGMVSLEQLLVKTTAQGQRLFRNKAFVNVIFVSDTHEPGANYFGRPGAPVAQRDLNFMQGLIAGNSPGVKSIKFSGVLPVPIVGDPRLVDLNVIGAVPQDLTEAVVGGENYNPRTGVETWWDYSYLPFIKGTGGVIAHPKMNDWTLLAAALMDDASFTGTLLVPVKYKIDVLQSVSVDGVVLDLSLVTVNSDRLSVNIKYTSRSTQRLKIIVKYISKP